MTTHTSQQSSRSRAAFTQAKPPRSLMERVTSWASQTSRLQRAALISAALLGVLGLGYRSSWTSSHQPVSVLPYKTDAAGCREVSNALLREGVPSQVINDEAVMVSPEDLKRAQLIIRDAHLTVRRPLPTPGFMGQTAGELQRQRQLELEHELSGYLREFAGVAYAQVKLGIPQGDSSLWADAPPVTAAVSFHLRPNTSELRPEQVSAMAGYVAAAVPELQSKNVKVIDLDTGIDLTDPNSKSSQRQGWQVAAKYAEYLRIQAQSQLDAVLGTDPVRSRVVVTCLYDFSQQETNLVTNGEPVLIGRQEGDELYDIETGQKIENIEPIETGPGEAKNKKYRRRMVSSKYSPANTTVHTVALEPRLMRVNVSVAFDNLPKDVVEAYSGLVRGGLGIDESRGDCFMVANVPFLRSTPADPPRPAAPPAPPKGNDFHWYSLAAFCSLLLMMPVGFIWLGRKSGGVLLHNEPTRLPSETITDLSDLRWDKTGKRHDTQMDATRPNALEKVASAEPKELAALLRSTWLGDRRSP